MSYKRVLIVSDNEVMLRAFMDVLHEHPELTAGRTFALGCSDKHDALIGKMFGDLIVKPLRMKIDYESVVKNYDLVISAHSKQMFPAAMVGVVKCINVHPGYNPHNRGWFPQVFSILNGLPLGATIHEIDAELDHGNIIAREKVPLHAWDTSITAYNRVQEQEIALLKRYLPDILEGAYQTTAPEEEGNLNLKKDYNALCEIDLNETVNFQQAIDRLRALTHPPYYNGYFIDPETDKRVWVRIDLKKDEEDSE